MKKKVTLTAFVFGKLSSREKWLDKCIKRPVSEDPSTSDMVKVPKHCWNLHHITLIRLIGQCPVNWVGKSFSYWHVKSWDCLLTHWLPMKSPVLNRDKLTIPIQMRLSQKQNTFSQFLAAFLKSKLNFKYFLKKRWPSFCDWINSPYPIKVKYKTKLLKLYKQKLFGNLFHHQC